MKRQTLKVFLTAFSLVGLSVICGLGSSIIPSHAESDDAKQSEVAPFSCPKCKGAMETGYVRDYFDSNSSDQSVWSPGHPKLHFLTQGTRIKITTYRCTNCGYLESYAK